MATLPTATIHVVTHHRTVRGVDVRRHDISTGHSLPWRIVRRSMHAHSIGLELVRALGDGGDVVAVTVSDGKRALASWRRMSSLPGFTGTHDVHQLIADILHGETYGAHLARITAA